MAGSARLDMRFDILAGGRVQLVNDIAGKLLELHQAAFMGTIRASLFCVRISMLLWERASHGERAR